MTELEEYMKEKGVDISVGPKKELLDRIYTIAEKCNAVFADKNMPPQGERGKEKGSCVC